METKVQNLIQDVVKLKDVLEVLRSLYIEVSGLFANEQSLLRKSDLAAIEKNLSLKEGLQKKIELKTDDVSRLLRAIRGDFEVLELEALAKGVDSLSGCLVSLGEFAKTSFTQDALAEKVFKDVVLKLEESLAKFKESMLIYQNIINTHFLVVKKGLENVQRSYHFWQELASEADSTYDASGAQKKSEQGSLLKVKI